MNIESARKLLNEADVFYGDLDDDDVELAQTLNMNDVWCWACAYGEYVPDEKLPEVARLFWRYGNAGLLYWVSEQHDSMKSEFLDNNRFIAFVRNEEALIKKIPESSIRAYEVYQYTLGDEGRE